MAWVARKRFCASSWERGRMRKQSKPGWKVTRKSPNLAEFLLQIVGLGTGTISRKTFARI